MNIAYSLNKIVASEKIIRDISVLCNNIPKEELPNSILVISIQKINNYQYDSLLPKIEYKEDNNDSLT